MGCHPRPEGCALQSKIFGSSRTITLRLIWTASHRGES
jgi:hypothetical protein